MRLPLLPLLLAIALAPLLPDSGFAAQESAARGGSFRPYWHVFVAYAAAWLLVAGWVFHIARRLSGVEERMEE